MSTKIENIDSAIKDILDDYSEEVINAVKKAIDEVADETKKVIDSNCTFNDITRKYRKSLKVDTVFEDTTGKKVVWHASGKEYRLTHLLENGHMTRDGMTRTRTYPHIKIGEEYAKEQLPKRIEEAIKNAKSN